MQTPSFKDYISGNQPKETGSKKVPSFSDYLKTQPPAKPSLLQKAGTLGKNIVKGIVSPVATTLARPIQLGAEVLGVTDAKVNEYTKRVAGDWIAPTPQNASDTVKDIGRAAQTVLLGAGGAALKTGGKVASVIAKESAIGAGFGAGVALEQGGTDTSFKDFLKQTAIGAGVGAVAPVVLKGASKLLSKKVAPVVEKEVPKAVIPEVVKPDIVPIVETKTIPSKFKKPTQKELATGYEPYTPESKLPVIEAGATPEFKSPTEVKTPKVVQPIIKETPEYVTSVTERVKKLDADPEFQSSSNSTVIRKFDEAKLKADKQDLIDMATGKNPNLPEGLTAPAIRKLMKYETGLTKEEKIRLSSSFVDSKAGKSLQGTQISKGSLIDNDIQMMEETRKSLVEAAKSKTITSKTVRKLLDDLEC